MGRVFMYNPKTREETSATPGDYWQLPNTYKFKGEILVRETFSALGGTKRVALKKNPTIADLKMYHEGI